MTVLARAYLVGGDACNQFRCQMTYGSIDVLCRSLCGYVISQGGIVVSCHLAAVMSSFIRYCSSQRVMLTCSVRFST